VFPVYDAHDRLTTFAARSAHRDCEDRWLYPLKSLLSRSIWPLNLPVDGTPIFVEGCPDALRLREYGYNAYAVLGNQLGDTKLDLIRDVFRRHDTLIVIPDNDNGGDILLEWFGKLVHQFKILVTRVEFDGNPIEGPDGTLKDIDEVGRHFGREPIDRIVTSTVAYQDLFIDKYYKSSTAPEMVTDLVKDQCRPVLKYEAALSVINQLYRPIR
jgi:DNA primase